MNKCNRPGYRAKAGPSSLQGSPAMGDVHALVDLFNRGQFEDMATFARQMTERFPRYSFGWKALGTALKQMGQDTQALLPMQKAASLSPNDAETYNNLGVLFRDLGRLDEAMSSLKRAIQIKPDYAEAHGNLGIAQRDLGWLAEAEASCRRALNLKPILADASNNLGTVLRDQGRLAEADVAYRQALQTNPAFYEAHNNLGILFKEQGRLEEASACFQRALQIKPDFVEALNHYGMLLIWQGKPVMALESFIQSLQIKETQEAKQLFVDCVKTLVFSEDNPEMRGILAFALSEPWGRPGELARIAVNLLKLEPVIGACMARAAEVWPQALSVRDLFGAAGLAAVTTDPLLHALLTSSLINDLEMERFLTQARRALLQTALLAGQDDAGWPFYSALGRQCFINEYVFACSEEETRLVNDLKDSLLAALQAGTPVSALSLLALAAYVPLHTLPGAERLLTGLWPSPVEAVLTQQIREPQEEWLARSGISSLTGIEDSISLQVRQQYEENPYPRWVKIAPAGKARNVAAALREKFPLASFSPLENRGIDFLVAGCGTGQHSIETAMRFLGSRILAIDLSLSSLAYASRKTRELGLKSIEYAQADLLKLGSINRTFDVIESGGVLHHLADPWAGWRALLSLLRPAGLMRLGFYSAVARRAIFRIREFITEQAYGSTLEEMRRCRQDLMAKLGEDFGGALKWTDFFSASACRDLLFHVQEHCLTLPAIEAFLRENGLVFLGFDLDGKVLHAYRQRFPQDPAATDLGLWHIFENENPDTFMAMYQFWVQRSSVTVN